ncbi:N-acetylmuramoyl-L-alanine amidase-like domain-containing protein [Gaoshiqia sediminis]|uniref:DUF1460 domain-containing protein n=1 Tax=Gaoshiqia sediminis TaxID=2986998 RepID=A0AA42C534_9BACT|nr:N-acetylmuramoyl-L-alanine amidase-like domain-containing protein [Gaoshiqia sediminis]MCW0481129.1 DUF1460 domain-containing protein [Gaoshiqia sediminis]
MLPKLAFLLMLYIIGHSCQTGAQKTDLQPEQVITTSEDRVILEKLLKRFSAEKMSVPLLTASIGKAFLGTRYVAYTLENGKDEQLVVNLREMDCTTFVENCLALAISLKSGEGNFATFVRNLEKIRYRDGKRDGYLSRLHYFSDWIYDNREKGLITEPITNIGSPFDGMVNFMSTHPDNYPVLKENPELVPLIVQQETVISTRKQVFLKKEQIRLFEDNLQEGDLVGLTTRITGLDISHTGILVRVNNRIHLLHASSSLEKVVISEEPLADLLMNRKSYTGIMVARPR